MTAIHRKYDPGDRRKSRMRYFRFFCYALFFLIMAIVLFGPKSCRRRIWNFSIGRLFQDPMKGTAPHMTIEENLALSYSRSQRRGLRLAVCRRDRDFFRSALAEFDMGLEDRMDTKVGLLSGGQRQALTLLMSTIVPPKLLLLDEHTAALDPATAEKVMAITNQIIQKNRLTTMMITHNIQSALSSGSRTVMMDSGKIILDLSGVEREKMTVAGLMELYRAKQHKVLDNDRMLLV